MTPPAADLDLLDGPIAAFERAWAEGQGPDLRAFLPPRDSSLFLPVLRELVRVDLELRWQTDYPRRLGDYLADYPDLAADRDSVEEIAFEEYRLRHRHGERPSSDEYQQALGVDTHDWFLPSGNGALQQPGPTRIVPGSPWVSSASASELGEAMDQFPGAGDTVAGFALEAELGRGAFGRVFVARQQGLMARRVAVKFLPAFFVSEAHALARLQHTHIMPLFSLHCCGKLVGLCMPCFGGKSLAELLRLLAAMPRLPASGAWLAEAVGGGATTEALRRLETSRHADAVLWLIGRLAEGLHHAHERGILHRDLKPANVLLSEEGVPLLLDFNLAEDVRQREVTAVRAGGTPGYMAPEYLDGLAKGSALATPATDLYALGLILYQLLTGRFPFPARQGPLGLMLPRMVRDRRTLPPAPSTINPAVPSGVDAIVARCLDPDPARRYRSAGELGDDLTRQLQHQPLAHAREGLRGRAAKWARRHPRLLSAGAIAALAAGLVLLLGAWLLMGVQKQRRLEAAQAHQELEQDLPHLAFLLASPDAEPRQLRDGEARCREWAERYGLTGNDWRQGPLLRSLDPEARAQTRRALAEMYWLWARARAWAPEGIEEARELNDRALELLDEGDAPAAFWRQREELCRRAGDADAARSARQPLGETVPQARDGYLDLLDQVGHGRFREALPLLRELTRREGTNATTWLLLAAGQAEVGRIGEARVSAEVAVALAPQSPWAWYRLGVYALSAKDYEPAQAAFRRVLALRGGLMEARLNLALALLGAGQPAEAEKELDQALEGSPDCTRVYFIRARARHARGDLTGARADHAEGLRREPNDEQSYLARSFARLPADPRGALADLDRALALNPRSATGLRNRAHVLAEHLQRPRDALRDLDQALAMHPADQLARAGRAVLRGRQGQREGAQADARQIVKEATEPGLIYQAACAFALSSAGRPADQAEALRLLRQALQAESRWAAIAPRDPDLAALHAEPAFRDLLRLAGEWQAAPGSAPRKSP